MVEVVRPPRGGFLRPFGCGWFIREFLMGHGPEGASVIDADVGAPQADIFHEYKEALFRKYVEDAVAREVGQRARRGDRPLTVAQMEERLEYYRSRIPYKLTSCRYHSFVVYFSNLQRLAWVEPTGREEASAFQGHYPPGPPRRYFRLTKTGWDAGDVAWANPLLTFYADRWGGEEAAREHLRQLRRNHRYIRQPRG